MREFTYKWKPEDYTFNGDDPVLKVTKSSFTGTYGWCPQKYVFSYIESLPQDTTVAMTKGTIIHNARQDFFDEYDIKKAEPLSRAELINYNYSMYPIDDYTDIYYAMSCFDADRFLEAKENNTVESYMPVLNEIKLDAEFMIRANNYSHVDLQHNYVIHLQGIIDRMYLEGGGYIPMELKTGPWGDHKATNMRKEMAFYKLLFDEATDEHLIEQGLDPAFDITHWGWYFPVSNHIHVEPVKKVSTTALLKGLATMIHSYETGTFPANYNERGCPNCSYFNICPAAHMAGWE
jgi:hypothetical protein